MARFTAKVAMRWQDMDAYGHVNNVQFLTYVEEARVEMFQSVPLSGLDKGDLGHPRRGHVTSAIGARCSTGRSPYRSTSG